MNIYIVGYPCCGKTTLGKKIAKKIGYGFVDLDNLFEEKYHIAISDFFDKYGEDTFRAYERQILFSTASLENTVIATGGGTPCNFDNMDFINNNGISVYFQRSVGLLAERLKNSKQRRPLFQNIAPENMFFHIQQQLSDREKFYLKAHIITSQQTTMEIVDTIQKHI